VVQETTALVAAYAAGSLLVFTVRGELRTKWKSDRVWKPAMGRLTETGYIADGRKLLQGLSTGWKLKHGELNDSAWLGEFLGTMILILLGDGVVAGVLLKKSKAEGSGWMVITELGIRRDGRVFVAIACWQQRCAFESRERWMAVRAGVSRKCCLLSLHKCWERWLVRRWYGYIFCRTGKKRRRRKLSLAVSVRVRRFEARYQTFLSEIHCDVCVGVCRGRDFSKAWLRRLANGVGPYLVGSLCGRWLSLGGPTGYAINPARDFGPRLTHAILPMPERADRTGATPRFRFWALSWVAHLQAFALRSLGT